MTCFILTSIIAGLMGIGVAIAFIVFLVKFIFNRPNYDDYDMTDTDLS